MVLSSKNTLSPIRMADGLTSKSTYGAEATAVISFVTLEVPAALVTVRVTG